MKSLGQGQGHERLSLRRYSPCGSSAKRMHGDAQFGQLVYADEVGAACTRPNNESARNGGCRRRSSAVLSSQ